MKTNMAAFGLSISWERACEGLSDKGLFDKGSFDKGRSPPSLDPPHLVYFVGGYQ